MRVYFFKTSFAIHIKMYFFNRENAFFKTKFLANLWISTDTKQKFYNLLQHERVILLYPSLKKMLPNFWFVLLVICEITLTLRHDAIFFEKRSTHTHSNWRQKKTLLLPYILTARLLKKTLTLKEVWQMVVFGKRKIIMHIHIAEIHGGSI